MHLFVFVLVETIMTVTTESKHISIDLLIMNVYLFDYYLIYRRYISKNLEQCWITIGLYCMTSIFVINGPSSLFAYVVCLICKSWHKLQNLLRLDIGQFLKDNPMHLKNRCNRHVFVSKQAFKKNPDDLLFRRFILLTPCRQSISTWCGAKDHIFTKAHRRNIRCCHATPNACSCVFCCNSWNVLRLRLQY